MKISLIVLAAAGVLATGGAAAQSTALATQQDSAFVSVQYRAEQRAWNVNEREARIRDRIERGMRDGRITDREARHLHRELRTIEWKERDFRNNNGRIGPREADELNRDLDRLAEHVRRQLRDEQRY